MDEIVTYFSSQISKNAELVRLEQILDDFKNGTFSSQISKVRNIYENEGKDEYRKAKKKLPAIAFCGEFAGGHAKENLVRHNNLLVFDIDCLPLDEMQRVQKILSEDGLILSFWVSPSGSGYKGLIRLEYRNVPEESTLDCIYKKAFEDATSIFKERFGLNLDKSCSDISRICYVCWDENLYVNDNSEKLIVDCSNVRLQKGKSGTKKGVNVIGSVFRQVNIKGRNRQHSRNVLSSIIKYLSKRNLSITYTYDEWLRVGFAIASTFNYDLGVKYYLALCKQ